jgi:hypothetical protein
MQTRSPDEPTIFIANKFRGICEYCVYHERQMEEETHASTKEGTTFTTEAMRHNKI